MDLDHVSIRGVHPVVSHQMPFGSHVLKIGIFNVANPWILGQFYRTKMEDSSSMTRLRKPVAASMAESTF